MAPLWARIVAALLLVAVSFVLGVRQSRAKPPDVLVRVYLPDQGRIAVMPLEEYLVGVVAAEMPDSFREEALKAQMVVARTYTVRRLMRLGSQPGCSLAPQADVCASPDTGQAYVDQAAYGRRHSRSATLAFWRRLQAAAAATRGLVITYQGQPIDALYHSDSIRFTASAAEYFGGDIPYLRAVSEPYGATAPRARATLSLPLKRIAAAFGQSTAALSQGVPVVARTATGRVAAVRVGERVVSGREFRERLGLNSTDFSDTVRGDVLQVTTQGYGHGVGMSQYGANEMAAGGVDFAAIIHHYYSGVRIAALSRCPAGSSRLAPCIGVAS